MTMKKVFEFGGYAAAVLLVAFGIAALVLGINGRNEVRTDVKRELHRRLARHEQDRDPPRPAVRRSCPRASSPSCRRATSPARRSTPAARAKCFASYMRIHTFESTGGKTYAEMGRFLTKDGKDTNDTALAAKDPKTGQPVENGARNLWVTETALTNALNTSFFAEQVSLFGIVVGDRTDARRPRLRDSRLHGLPVAARPRGGSEGRAGTCRHHDAAGRLDPRPRSTETGRQLAGPFSFSGSVFSRAMRQAAPGCSRVDRFAD